MPWLATNVKFSFHLGVLFQDAKTEREERQKRKLENEKKAEITQKVLDCSRSCDPRSHEFVLPSDFECQGEEDVQEATQDCPHSVGVLFACLCFLNFAGPNLYL